MKVIVSTWNIKEDFYKRSSILTALDWIRFEHEEIEKGEIEYIYK